MSTTQKLIQCRFFAWRLFRRDSVYYADGRSNRPSLRKHSLHTRDRHEALERLRCLDTTLARQRGLTNDRDDAPGARDIPITTAWKEFLDYCQRPAIVGGVSPKTFKRYRAVRDKHQAFCEQQGIVDWSAVTRAHAEAYGRELCRRDYSDRTMYLELNLLVQITKWLIAEEKLSESCRFTINLQKPTGTETYCFTRPEVVAMLKRCRDEPTLNWLHPLLATLAMTGLRIGEAEGLRWSDVDLETGFLRLQDERSSSKKRQRQSARTTKGKRGRGIPLHHELSALLRELPRHPDGFVFHGPRGGRLKQDTARTIFRREVIVPLCKSFETVPGEVGFADGRFHGFRNYFVSQCFAHGASEGEVKEWVGHKDSAMVAHYRHQFDDLSRQRIQRVQFVTESGGGESDGLTPDLDIPESEVSA